ncbi:MAG: TIGR04282 family arsenosugar biosynthesis glycosyltransferase [Puniceicoccaceae bacterium]
MPPAICLVFLKAPQLGQVKTRLAATTGALVATEIFRATASASVRAIPSSWEVVISYTPPQAEQTMRQWLDPLRPALSYRPQHEGDLGNRLNRAFEEANPSTRQPVFAIGGDCPDLSPKIFEQALETLQESDCVLGPALDGGYYLIGTRAHHPILFSGIPWSTEEVLAKTCANATRSGLKTILLEPLPDIDTEEDLKNLPPGHYLHQLYQP